MNLINRRDLIKSAGAAGLGLFTGCALSPSIQAVNLEDAQNDMRVRARFVGERKAKTLSLIAELYGKETAGNIQAVEYVDRFSVLMDRVSPEELAVLQKEFPTHFTSYGQNNSEQIFGGAIAVRSIGATNHAFEGKGSLLIQNEADFMAALVSKEGGLVHLINHGAGGLTPEDFQFFRPVFDRNLYAAFAECYTFGLTYRHLKEGRFSEFGENSSLFTTHQLNAYFFYMAETYRQISELFDLYRNKVEHEVLKQAAQSVTKIMKTLRLPLTEHLPERHLLADRFGPFKDPFLKNDVFYRIDYENGKLEMMLQDESSETYTFPE